MTPRLLKMPDAVLAVAHEPAPLPALRVCQSCGDETLHFGNDPVCPDCLFGWEIPEGPLPPQAEPAPSPRPSWMKVFVDGFAPLFTDEQLRRLALALRSDDERLIQGATTTPPAMACAQELPCSHGCGVSFVFIVDGSTVGDVEKAFALACHECDQRLQEPAACRWFINWFDDTPRDVMRRELLTVVESILESRGAAEPKPLRCIKCNALATDENPVDGESGTCSACNWEWGCEFVPLKRTDAPPREF